jgi:hypothetical protein
VTIAIDQLKVAGLESDIGRRARTTIAGIAHSRADRLGRRTRNRMTLGRAGQRAAGEHAGADNPDAGPPYRRAVHPVLDNSPAVQWPRTG